MKIKNIFYFSIGPIGAALLGLVTIPLISWFFSAEEVGRFSMLQIFLSLSVSVIGLSMHQAYVREYYVEDRASLLKACVMPGIIIYVLALIILTVTPLSLSKVIFDDESLFLDLSLYLAIICAFGINILAHVLRMQERAFVFSLTKVLPKVLLIILVSGAVLYDENRGFNVLVFANTVSIILAFSLFFWVTKSLCFEAFYVSLDKILLEKMLRFSFPLLAGGLAYWGLTSIDRFFIKKMEGFDRLAVYALAVSLASGISVITSIFASLWHPALYRWVEAGVEKKEVLHVMHCLIILVAFIWSLFGVVTPFLTMFFPEYYHEVEKLIVACVAMPLFYLMSEVTGVGINIARKTKFIFFSVLFSLLINFTLNYILIPYYGIYGAAISSVFSFLILFVLKTEISAMLWFGFPRFKIYSVLFLYVLMTIFVIFEKDLVFNSYLWISLFFISLVLYYRDFFKACVFLKSKLISGE